MMMNTWTHSGCLFGIKGSDSVQGVRGQVQIQNRVDFSSITVNVKLS